eukprot:2709560-Pleurochrysis_carterae.AAC.1
MMGREGEGLRAVRLSEVLNVRELPAEHRLHSLRHVAFCLLFNGSAFALKSIEPKEAPKA